MPNTTTVTHEIRQALAQGDVGGAVAWLDTLATAQEREDALSNLTANQRLQIANWESPD